MNTIERAWTALMAGNATLAADESVYIDGHRRWLRLIANALKDRSPEQIIDWLDTPHDELDGETPRSCLRLENHHGWISVGMILQKSGIA